MTVRKAIIPAAGLGTRFLPATKAIPKEMIPVIDKPGIQYCVEECVRAGITDILFVTGMGKSAMEDHFDRSIALENHLEQSGKLEELEALKDIAALAEIHSVRQKEPLGLGHAVLMGRQHAGNESFAVLLPDEIVPGPIGDETDLLAQMSDIHTETGRSVIAVQPVPAEEISAYGVIAAEFVRDDLARVTGMVEKPSVGDAPSDLGARGRYIFTPPIFDLIAETEPGVGGEIQLTDAIRALAETEGVYAYVHAGPSFDVGKKLEYLRATIELALRREDLAQGLRSFLADVAARPGAE